MKKLLVFIFALVFLVSCGSSAVVNDARKTMKGNWQITSVTYPGNADNLAVSLLNDIPANCLENSTWQFVSNNNTGTFQPSGMNCDTSERYFIWTIDEVDAAGGNYDLMFKPTNAKHKSEMGNAGYRLNLINLTGSTMVWEQTVNFEGKPFTIRMNFSKN